MALQRITAPAATCVDLATAKAQCRVDSADEDALIGAMISAATDEAEGLLRRAILPQQWRLSLEALPISLIELHRPPVVSVDAFRYVDTAGVLQTLPQADYQVSLSHPLYGRVMPAYGKSWPSVRSQLDAVQIDFTAGWAAAEAVPPAIKQWVLMRVAAYYENREAWTLGQSIQRNSFVDRLLDRWRVPSF